MESKEKDLSISSEACIVKELRYTTNLSNGVYSNNTLRSILDKIESIDFISVYHQDKPKVLETVDSLRRELKDTKDEDNREKLNRKLQGYEPAVTVKHTIVINNLLSVAENANLNIGVINSNTYIYNGCFWELFDQDLINCFLAEVSIKGGYHEFQAHKTATIKMLLNQLNRAAVISKKEQNVNRVMINLLNGTFVYENGEYSLQPFNLDDMLTYQLNFDYSPDAECPQYMKFLDRVMPEKDAQCVMAEYVGYILAKSLRLEQCLVLTGTGRNGKSTWIDIVKAMLGEENVAPFSLADVCDSTGYYRAEIGKYLLCYSNEMSTKGCNPDLVKQLISGQDVMGRAIFKSPIKVSNYCRFLFSANVLPRDIEQSEGYYRRFMFLKFGVEIPKEEVNPNLANNIIKEELSGVLNWVINEGLLPIARNQRFSHCDKIDKMNNRFKMESSNVAMFMFDSNYIPSKREHQTSKTLYSEYKLYCEENGARQVGATEFIRRLEENLKYTIKRRATGNATWIYCEKNEEAKEELAAMERIQDGIGKLFNLK